MFVMSTLFESWDEHRTVFMNTATIPLHKSTLFMCDFPMRHEWDSGIHRHGSHLVLWWTVSVRSVWIKVTSYMLQSLRTEMRQLFNQGLKVKLNSSKTALVMKIQSVKGHSVVYSAGMFATCIHFTQKKHYTNHVGHV